MKKYFLLIILFAFMFLGLGNYSSALCFTDADCVGGICNTTNGQCINNPNPGTSNTPTTCFTDADCIGGICNTNNGQCINNPNSSNNTPSLGTVPSGGFCTETLNCKSGLICFNNKCMTDPSIATNDCSNCTKLSTSDDLAKGCDSTKDQKICGDGLYCCPKAAGTPCSPPTGGVKGTINPFSCSCPDGQGENADRVCKPCTDDDVCCGIKLNTKIPFIGNCIENTTQGGTMDEGSAFPILITALMKILITAILIVSFILIIIGGVMIATGGASPENVTTGKKMIKNVIIGLAILGAIGVILRLINPNFFG